jgi:hypothetical protein
MRRIFWLVIGVVVGGACVGGGLQYHIVRTRDGFTCVPKQKTSLADTYVDVREWGPTDWMRHPDLASSLSQNGHKDMLNEHTLETGLKDTLRIK